MAGQFVVRVDPYEIQVANGVDFTEEVLRYVFGLTDDWANRANGPGNRWHEHDDGTWVFLQNLTHHTSRAHGQRPATEYWLGSACRARTEELPQQVTRDGVSPLAIADDDEDGGVLEHVAFLWEPARSLLWLQRERDVGKTALFTYLRRASGVAVGLVPVFATDAPQQAKRMRDVKKIDVTYLVGATNRRPKGFFRVINELEGYGAATIEIKITPRRGEYLDPAAREAVTEIADEVIENSGTIRKARVWGDLSQEDANVLVDLLKERSDFSTPVDREKSRDPDRLMKAVRNVWLSHRDDIRVVK